MSTAPITLDRDYLRELSADGLLWHSEGMPEHKICAALIEALDQVDALLAAAKTARAALSDLIATRAPKVYADALRELDDAINKAEGTS